MLYEEGQLTESQAQQIIGEKMVARINFLNKWCSENGYVIKLHSTFKGCVEGIFSKEGLHNDQAAYISEETDRKQLFYHSNISEKELKFLEDWIKNNAGKGKINGATISGKSYETDKPGNDVTKTYSQISSKLLLEYSKTGEENAIVVMCVPKKKSKGFTLSDDEFEKVSGEYQQNDPYIRRMIGCRYDDRGLVYISRFFYPQESILFAFDRENNRIKFNDSFDEEYYLDDTTPQKGIVHRGEVLQGLRNLEQQIGKTQSSGRSR